MEIQGIWDHAMENIRQRAKLDWINIYYLQKITLRHNLSFQWMFIFLNILGIVSAVFNANAMNEFARRFDFRSYIPEIVPQCFTNPFL